MNDIIYNVIHLADFFCIYLFIQSQSVYPTTCHGQA